MLKKRYHRTHYGQVHSRTLEATGDETQRPLLCLHPGPSSGLYFSNVMPLLNQGRRVIAPDYPGYGGSDPLDTPPDIGDYAQAMLQAFTQESSMDVLGFHTGCLVATEMALMEPTKINRLILIDIPYFTEEKQTGLREKMSQPLPLDTDLSCLTKAWDFNVTSRLGQVSLDRAFELFTENLRAGTKDFYGFRAAFSYDCAARFAELTTTTDIIATKSGLLEATHHAAEQVTHARLTQAEEITTAVFESSAPLIAEIVRSILR